MIRVSGPIALSVRTQKCVEARTATSVQSVITVPRHLSSDITHAASVELETNSTLGTQISEFCSNNSTTRLSHRFFVIIVLSVDSCLTTVCSSV